MKWFLLLLVVCLVIMFVAYGWKSVVTNVASSVFIALVARVVARYAD